MVKFRIRPLIANSVIWKALHGDLGFASIQLRSRSKSTLLVGHSVSVVYRWVRPARCIGSFFGCKRIVGGFLHIPTLYGDVNFITFPTAKYMKRRRMCL